ncbi:hypothetical protein GYH30_001029 [Glycine max]|nr:hypothetical protein GYH30_001029 [Glycine max]
MPRHRNAHFLVTIRTFVGTNLSPLWERFLAPSEGNLTPDFQNEAALMSNKIIKKGSRGWGLSY